MTPNTDWRAIFKWRIEQRPELKITNGELENIYQAFAARMREEMKPEDIHSIRARKQRDRFAKGESK